MKAVRRAGTKAVYWDLSWVGRLAAVTADQWAHGTAEHLDVKMAAKWAWRMADWRVFPSAAARVATTAEQWVQPMVGQSAVLMVVTKALRTAVR